MNGFDKLNETTMSELAAYLDVEYSAAELTAAANRLETLKGIYHELEETPIEALLHDEYYPETFRFIHRRPGLDDDPYNSWLSRFELSRSETEGPLTGQTVAIKDNICVRGVELTCGSRAFRGIVPTQHAPVVDRLLGAGAEIVGKTNMDELAFGPTSETSAFGPTENPRAKGHVAGGSSAGSAAAVAAGEVDLALGTDTGGSVRIPASYCGIVGMKPTYGRVPLTGVVPLAYSMDHVGTLARDVKTAASGLSCIADYDSSGDPLVNPNDLGLELNSLTIGLMPEIFERHTSERVEKKIRDVVSEFADAGAVVKEVDIRALPFSRQAWWGIAPSEFAAEFVSNAVGQWRKGRSARSISLGISRVRRASSNLLGSNIKEMLMLGAYLNKNIGGYYYGQARNLREALTTQFESAFSETDLLAAPGTPTTAPEIGGFERGVTPPVNWVTHQTNLTGHPSITVPCGEIDDLPIGLQLIGSLGADQKVMDAAYAYQDLA